MSKIDFHKFANKLRIQYDMGYLTDDEYEMELMLLRIECGIEIDA